MNKKIGNIELEYRTLENNAYETIDYCTINGDIVGLDTYYKVEAEIKKAKAFDIVVKKKVKMSLLQFYKDRNVYKYNNMILIGNYGEQPLTQEEWDLLKDVLQ